MTTRDEMTDEEFEFICEYCSCCDGFYALQLSGEPCDGCDGIAEELASIRKEAAE